MANFPKIICYPFLFGALVTFFLYSGMLVYQYFVFELYVGGAQTDQ